MISFVITGSDFFESHTPASFDILAHGWFDCARIYSQLPLLLSLTCSTILSNFSIHIYRHERLKIILKLHPKISLMKCFIYVSLVVAVMAATVRSAPLGRNILEEAFKGKTALAADEVEDLAAKFSNLRPIKTGTSSSKGLEAEVGQPNAPRIKQASRTGTTWDKRPSETGEDTERRSRSRD